MAIKINFDVAHNPEEPTIVLAKRSGDKLGKINAKAIQVTDSLNEAAEMTFNVYKYIDGEKDLLWDKITNFKLVHCVEWDMWFEITVEVDESNETVKTVFCTQLGQAELSQIMLYDIEINTEIDIEREEYIIPTVLYDENNPEASLLHRIMEKAPHYSVAHVDHTIANIQRTFTFSDTSIYDAMQEIAEEIHCLFVFHSNSDDDGKIQRTISVYDLESNCLNPDCKYRGEFSDVCPECGGADVQYYGKDTTIFVTSDELAEDIQLTFDTEATKNCFKLEGGDDLMTATIRNCNPNGSDYIWYLSDEMKEDMSDILVSKLDSYDAMYDRYQTDIISISKDAVDAYNNLVDKYKKYNEDLERIEFAESSLADGTVVTGFKGYPSLINAYYNAVDMYLFLQSGLMPTIETARPSIEEVVAKLTSANLSPVAVNVSSTSTVSPLKSASVATVDNIVLSMAKTLVDSRYKVKIAENSTLTEYIEGASERYWRGKFIVTAYSDDEITATTDTIEVAVNADYETFVERKLDKALCEKDAEDVSVSGLFKKPIDDFKESIKEYSFNSLSSFHDACQACIDILIQQGVADDETWAADGSLYTKLYAPYREKLAAIAYEMEVRQSEINSIIGVYDEDGDLSVYGLQNYIEEAKSYIQERLDFQRYISEDVVVQIYSDEGEVIDEVIYSGKDLWVEFCSFRREDKYSNDNYISEGLNNAELIKYAEEFLNVAHKEIYKSAELQRMIASSLYNLLVIKKFEPLVDSFEVGNFIRVMVDDKVYKIRLMKYDIDYDNIGNISVEFSDVIGAGSSVNTVKDVLEQASSMATSYSSVQRQASQGESSRNQLNNWAENGLALTNMKIVGDADNQNVVWDDHGILCREYIPETDSYDDRQLKIINRGLYVTTDNWQTSKAGIGNFIFYNPRTKQEEEGYGVIADTLVGDLILSEDVGIYTENNSITLNENGVVITVDTDADANQTAFTIQSESDGEITKLLSVESDGSFALNGVAKITTDMGYEFGNDGLVITKEGSEKANQLSEEGMVVYRYGDPVLTANDNGVTAEDLRATTYLIIGEHSRFEGYMENNKQRTGCFWIG